MLEFRTKFVHNLLENVILSEMVNKYGEDIYDKCIMDVSVGCSMYDFYQDYMQAALVATIGNFESTQVPSSVEILQFNLTERVGAFSQQYDLVVAFDTFNNYLDDFTWQATLENLLFYLKPGGLCFINGVFPKVTTEDAIRIRSRGIWKALVKKNGCAIVSILENFSSFFCKDDKIMVIKK